MRSMYVWDKDKVRLFWDFVAERQNVYFLKEVRKIGTLWTKDPILQNYHFCNVYRELDKGTKYCMQNIIESGERFNDVVFNVFVYRLFNSPSTFDIIGFTKIGKFNGNKIGKELERRKAQGATIFNPSYMTSGKGCAERGKAYEYCVSLQNNQKLIGEIAKEFYDVRSLDEAWKHALRVPYFGPFIAYQVVLDVSYSVDNVSWDCENWVYPGPGAKKGVNILLKGVEGSHVRNMESSTGKYKSDVYEEAIKELTVNSTQELKRRDFRFIQRDLQPSGELGLQNVEFSLCEFQKYWRIKNGGGHVRRRR